jgi:hypothetical protein
MKKLTILAIFTLVIATAHSQNITSKGSAVATLESGSDLPAFVSYEDAEKLIGSIIDVVGLKPNFKLKEANVPNVEATIRHHKRYILYNPEFISLVNKATKDKWSAIFILAHEIGHHLNGHTVMGKNSRPAIELEADEFAGFVLSKMGATLDQAQLVMNYIAKPEETKTHPARADRMDAIKKGWDKAKQF